MDGRVGRVQDFLADRDNETLHEGGPMSVPVDQCVATEVEQLKVYAIANTLRRPEFYRAMELMVKSAASGDIVMRHATTLDDHEFGVNIDKTVQNIEQWTQFAQRSKTILNETQGYSRLTNTAVWRALIKEPELLVLPTETQSLSAFIIEHTPLKKARLPGNIVAFMPESYVEQFSAEQQSGR